MKHNPFIALLALLGVIGATTFGAYSLARQNLITDLVGRGLLSEHSLASLSGAVISMQEQEAQIVALKEAALLYKRAKEASERGDWFAVKALLGDSPATESIEYPQYASALLLLSEAKEKVSKLEAKLADDLAVLRAEAKVETAARKAAEAAQEKTAGELDITKQAKEEQKAALLKELSVSEEDRQAALRQVAQEERDAFINEFDVYLSLLSRVDVAFISAEGEIESGRDAQSLVYINQAEDSIGQVGLKATDLRDNRTPTEYQDEIAELLRGVGVYQTVGKKYRLMVAELPAKGETYNTYKSAAVTARLDGKAVVQKLLSFVSSSR